MNTCVIATFIMPDVTKLSEELSKSTNESFMTWHEALTKGTQLAQEAQIDPDAFLMLARNCSDSGQFLSITKTLNSYSKENPYGNNAFNLIDCFVEKSSYPLKDWIESLDYFCDWLKQNFRQADLTTMLHYIANCICIKGANQIEFKRFSLKEQLEKVLRTFGFQD